MIKRFENIFIFKRLPHEHFFGQISSDDFKITIKIETEVKILSLHIISKFVI